MALPPELKRKMTLWRDTARVERYTEGLFLEASWVAVYLGQGVVPHGYDQRADIPPPDRVAQSLGEFEAAIRHRVAAWPDHAAYLKQAGAWEAA